MNVLHVKNFLCIAYQYNYVVTMACFSCFTYNKDSERLCNNEYCRKFGNDINSLFMVTVEWTAYFKMNEITGS